MSKELNVKLSNEELKHILKNVVKTKDFAECVVALLEQDDEKKEVLVRAAMGIPFTQEYKVGEKVVVETYYLRDWCFDKQAMEEAGIIKNRTMVCLITNFTKYSTTPYTVRYDYIDLKQTVLKNIDDDIKASAIKRRAEELPGDEKDLPNAVV